MTTRRTPPTFVRLARIAGWNAVLILGGLALIALAGEAWLRLTAPPFEGRSAPSRFVPGVGVLYEPHAEVRHTNGSDYWTIQRANSLGFLDREPPGPARAAASCHVAVFGDSYVDAREVPVTDKLHVRLEALAAAALPELDVTASAWGRQGTGQANQLPYYDEYARALRPNLLALVFFHNDFSDHSRAGQAIRWGWNPDRAPFALPERAEDGSVRLRPPDPGWAEHAMPWLRTVRQPGLAALPAPNRIEAAARALTGRSRLARWLGARLRAPFPDWRAPRLPQRAEQLAERPGYGWILDGWEPTNHGPDMDALYLAEDPPPLFAEALEFTAWTLAEFKRRADRDGAAIVILATHENGGADSRTNAVLRGMAGPLGIPVIDQHDWIVSRGGRIEDAEWPNDHHWSPQGHQWAAEALLGWLRRHPEVCED